MATVPALSVPVPQWAGSAGVDTLVPMGAVIGLHFLLQSAGFLLSFGIGDAFLPVWQSAFFVVILAGFPLILVSQVLRYRNYSTPVERQQTKWFVGSLALLAILEVYRPDHY